MEHIIIDTYKKHCVLDIINKEEDDERLLRRQNQAIDKNDEVHEDIINELEDMDDEDDSA